MVIICPARQLFHDRENSRSENLAFRLTERAPSKSNQLRGLDRAKRVFGPNSKRHERPNTPTGNHFARYFCLRKLMGNSNPKVRKSYKSGSQSSALEDELIIGLGAASNAISGHHLGATASGTRGRCVRLGAVSYICHVIWNRIFDAYELCSSTMNISPHGGTHTASHRKPERSLRCSPAARQQSNDDGYFAATTSLA